MKQTVISVELQANSNKSRDRYVVKTDSKTYYNPMWYYKSKDIMGVWEIIKTLKEGDVVDIQYIDDVTFKITEITKLNDNKEETMMTENKETTPMTTTTNTTTTNTDEHDVAMTDFYSKCDDYKAMNVPVDESVYH